MSTGKGNYAPVVIALLSAGCVEDVVEPDVATNEQALVLPSGAIEATSITLSNGDAADVYAPSVPRR